MISKLAVEPSAGLYDPAHSGLFFSLGEGFVGKSSFVPYLGKPPILFCGETLDPIGRVNSSRSVTVLFLKGGRSKIIPPVVEVIKVYMVYGVCGPLARHPQPDNVVNLVPSTEHADLPRGTPSHVSSLETVGLGGDPSEKPRFWVVIKEHLDSFLSKHFVIPVIGVLGLVYHGGQA